MSFIKTWSIPLHLNIFVCLFFFSSARREDSAGSEDAVELLLEDGTGAAQAVDDARRPMEVLVAPLRRPAARTGAFQVAQVVQLVGQLQSDLRVTENRFLSVFFCWFGHTLTSLAWWLAVGAWTICSRLRSSDGSDLSSVTSRTMDVTCGPNVRSSSSKVVSVSST